MSIQLLQTLIHNALTPADPDRAERAGTELAAASERDWQESLMSLALHRLTSLAFYGLQLHGLVEKVPQPFRSQLQDSYQQTRTKNAVFLLTLDGIVQTTTKRNLHPVFWKGIVLADSFYPDMGMRAMSDIDLEIDVNEQAEIAEVLTALGFQCAASTPTGDAFYYTNPMRIALDIHHRNRLFEGKESLGLTIDLVPQQMKVPTFRVLEPNAMLVHLVVHMDGHRYETGPMLSWILDIAFVMRKWGDRIDLQRLEQLMPDKANTISLFRTLHFLEAEFGEQPPQPLAKAIEPFAPYTLAEVLRQRRLAMWELPSARGWLRLGADRLGIKLKQFYPKLETSDLLLWIGDELEDRRVARQPLPAADLS
jgi:Uncharacterised nucleotidyltransferase